MPEIIIFYKPPHPPSHQGSARRPRQADDGQEHRLKGKTGFARFNAKLGLLITVGVGTMICAYVFAIIALISLPSAIKSQAT